MLQSYDYKENNSKMSSKFECVKFSFDANAPLGVK